MCKLISYVVPDGPPYYAASQATKAVTKCEEHNWMMEGATVVDGLCPLGRIEKAVEDGLARLATASH